MIWHERGLGGPFEETSNYPDGPGIPIFSILRAVRRFRPDVVHAHSSWAGMMVRVVLPTVPIIYQPHCYAFENRARGGLSRAVSKLVERVLTLRTHTVVALTDREVQVARSLSRKNYVHMVPNAPSPGVVRRDSMILHDPPSVVMCGRLAGQKDPLFFAEVADLLRRDGEGVEMTWIGDGDECYRDVLEESGVRVTGWISESDVRLEYARGDIYLHSAPYEGFPLSVLDAAKQGMAVIVRDAPCFDGTPLRRVGSPKDAAGMIARMITSSDLMDSVRDESSSLLRTMNAEEQARALAGLYRSFEKGNR